MEPVWMNAYHCVFDRSFEEYVHQLPQPEELEEKLHQRNYMFCWLFTPQLEEVMIFPGETAQMELVGASYCMENGSPVQNARYYRYTNLGEKDFIMITEDGFIIDNLSFEEMVVQGSNLDRIQSDLY